MVTETGYFFTFPYHHVNWKAKIYKQIEWLKLAPLCFKQRMYTGSLKRNTSVLGIGLLVEDNSDSSKKKNGMANLTGNQLPLFGTDGKSGTEANGEERISSRPDSPRTATDSTSAKPKLQISNNYLLAFDQLTRVLNILLENKESKRIKRKLLTQNTGLAERHVETLVSIGTAMGLIKPRVQILTPVGLIIATHDIFFEKNGTLEWFHYKGAGRKQNLIWFDIFNHLLVEQSPMKQEDWQEYFRKKLKGQYSNKTLTDHIPKEIRFLVDAYTVRRFNKLEILRQSPDSQLYRQRYNRFAPLVFSAMIYDFCAAKGTRLFQVDEMAATPGSPAVVFGLDAVLLRQQIEGLHDRGWLRYETTHNLNQTRLKPGFSTIEFLTAYFENREPRENTNPSPGGVF
jgi:hypothetical protein